MDIKVWEFTKSISLIAIVAFLWFQGSAFIQGFNRPSTIPPEITKQLAENQMVMQNMVADSKAAKQLIQDLKDQKGQQADFIKKIEEENKKKNAKLDEIGVVITKLKQSVDLKNRDSDKTYVNEKKPIHSYDFKKIYAKDAKGEPFPVAWVMYYPNQTEDKRWKSGTYPLEYYTTVIESENKDGSFSRAAEFHLENNQMRETKGREFPIDMKDIQWEKFEQSEKQMFWWNPRVAFGAAWTVDEIAPNFNISLSSYGKTERDMDYRFFTFGLGVSAASEDTNFIMSVEPLSWNLGNAFPLIENFFVGPVITINQETEYSFGVQTSIPF